MLNFFNLLESINVFLWSYVGFPVILFVGFYLTYKSRGMQLRKFPSICKSFFDLWLKKTKSDDNAKGVHPIKAFFASVGGCVGIGNVVGVTAALQIGGPGSLFWMWLVAIIGSIIKYAEVYLGIIHRVEGKDGSFKGGPMYFLNKAFSSWAVKLFCVLMCLYGVEIYQFSVMCHSVSENFYIDKIYVVLFMLVLVFFAEAGGVKRIGSISGTVIPIFMVLYIGMSLYVLVASYDKIPGVLLDIFHYAFSPHAPIGAFVGSSLSSAISQGVSRSCYSSDIGVGYASIMHSETSAKNPGKQAQLTIFEVFLDTFVICSTSIVIVLATGSWKENIDSMYLVQTALSNYFPYMNYFVPFFLFLLGYSTIITYFCAGMRTALHLFPRHGRKLYYLYSLIMLPLFSYVDNSQANTVVSLVLISLLLLNLTAIIRLRHQVSFDIEDVRETVSSSALEVA